MIIYLIAKCQYIVEIVATSPQMCIQVRVMVPSRQQQQKNVCVYIYFFRDICIVIETIDHNNK